MILKKEATQPLSETVSFKIGTGEVEPAIGEIFFDEETRSTYVYQGNWNWLKVHESALLSDLFFSR